jgi:hypothetical protein
MAKRFTDSEKWDDPWFAELPLKYKLFWIYLLDECDHAGVWKVNFRKAQFMIGEPFEQSEVLRYISDRVLKIDESYWLILKFVNFQYGSLNASKTAVSARRILEKHGLTDFIEQNEVRVTEGLDKGYLTLKDKDTDKDKVISSIKSEPTNFPTIEDCKQASQMSGFTKEQGEAYYHFRNANGWMVARGKDGNLFPIANWRSDMVMAISKGYIERNLSKNGTFDQPTKAPIRESSVQFDTNGKRIYQE